MEIEKALSEYKKNIGKIKTVEERCSYWQYCLETMSDDEIASEFICEKQDTYGMPKTRNHQSPVESELIVREVTRQMVKQWIKDDQSRIRPLKHEIQQIQIALEALTEEENYIIECKCIDKWKWRQVEIAFNERFRKEDDISEERLKRIKMQALKKMEEIINI